MITPVAVRLKTSWLYNQGGGEEGVEEVGEGGAREWAREGKLTREGGKTK